MRKRFIGIKGFATKLVIGAAIAIGALSSCSSPRWLVFGKREWHISDYFGQIIDADTTFRMTLGSGLIPRSPAIISSADSVAKYPGMDKFMAGILHTAHLDSAEILFYAPEMMTMFVIPKGNMTGYRPSSITVNMGEDNQYTMWVNDDDAEEDWTRQPSEMYTYTFVDKRKHRLVIVDTHDYGTTPIAQITVAQSRCKATDSMKVPMYLHSAFLPRRDIAKYYSDLEFWSYLVESRRQRAVANYLIGKEQQEKNNLR